jgi:DNA repair protein RadC
MESKYKVSEIQVTYKPAIGEKPIICSALDAYNEFKQFFDQGTIALQENFMVMYLNRSSRVLGIYPLSKGGITGTVADIRLILSVALKIAATSIILAHNHPSGSVRPSGTDIELTQKITEAARIMDIKVLDHIILTGAGKYYSFGDEGMI